MSAPAMAETPNRELRVRLAQRTPIPLDVSLRCEAGEMLALTGPSGSGKTTVLRAIAGLTSPATGHIACNGRIWYDTETGVRLSAQQRRVGLVFQQYALFPHLDCEQNVSIAINDIPKAERSERARELLAMTNMEGLESRRPHALSGGQRQRVALARALARSPDVLLLDEPFSAVDQLTRRRLYRELALLRQRLQLPVLLVTHDMQEVQQLADSLCLIRRGQTLQSGPVNNVMQKPLSSDVARLLGHQNLVDGVVTGSSDVGGDDDVITRVAVLGTELSCQGNALPAGTEVSVLVPPSAIVLHRRDRPSRGERENPISGVVRETLILGDDCRVVFSADAHKEQPLAFTLSRHVAARNGIDVGEVVSVSLLSEGIHLMPRESRH